MEKSFDLISSKSKSNNKYNLFNNHIKNKNLNNNTDNSFSSKNITYKKPVKYYSNATLKQDINNRSNSSTNKSKPKAIIKLSVNDMKRAEIYFTKHTNSIEGINYNKFKNINNFNIINKKNKSQNKFYTPSYYKKQKLGNFKISNKYVNPITNNKLLPKDASFVDVVDILNNQHSNLNKYNKSKSKDSLNNTIKNNKYNLRLYNKELFKNNLNSIKCNNNNSFIDNYNFGKDNYTMNEIYNNFDY